MHRANIVYGSAHCIALTPPVALLLLVEYIYTFTHTDMYYIRDRPRRPAKID